MANFFPLELKLCRVSNLSTTKIALLGSIEIKREELDEEKEFELGTETKIVRTYYLAEYKHIY